MIPDLFDTAVDQWKSGRFQTLDGFRASLNDYRHQADSKMNVTVISVSGDDPGDFAIQRAFHNVDLRADWSYLRDYPDADYIRRCVAPQYSHVKASQVPMIDTVRTKMQSVFAVYDRLLLPVHHEADQILSLTRTRMILEPFEPEDGRHITPRESEIVTCLATGMSAKETAISLALSPRTVEHRIDALKRRFRAKNVTHLVSLVMALELPVRDRPSPPAQSRLPSAP